MTNKNVTRRSLMASVLALLLCFSALAGTTFAWFTDTVTSGPNTIESGWLDVELWHSTYSESAAADSQWGIGFGYQEAAGEQIEGNTKLFLNKNGQAIKWEPGAAAVENFRVKNTGDVALKFKFSLDIANATKTPEGKALTDILTLMVQEIKWQDNGVPGGSDIEGVAKSQLLDDGFSFEKVLLPGENYDFWTGIEWNPSDVDNEYNIKGGLKLDFAVNLIATQYTHEVDDYQGDQYDKGAEYPEIALPPITNAADLQAAFDKGGEFVLGGDVAFEDELVIPAGKDVVIDLAGNDLVANNMGEKSALVVEGNVTFVNTADTPAAIKVDGVTPNAVVPAIGVAKTGTLNFEDGAIVIEGETLSAGIISEGGTVNFTGGTISVNATGATYGIFATAGTINVDGGEIVVDAPNAKEAYGIITMHGTTKVNLNTGKITVNNAGHYGVAVLDGTLDLTIADGFVWSLVNGAYQYGNPANVGTLIVNGVEQ